MLPTILPHASRCLLQMESMSHNMVVDRWETLLALLLMRKDILLSLHATITAYLCMTLSTSFWHHTGASGTLLASLLTKKASFTLLTHKTLKSRNTEQWKSYTWFGNSYVSDFHLQTNVYSKTYSVVLAWCIWIHLIYLYACSVCLEGTCACTGWSIIGIVWYCLFLWPSLIFDSGQQDHSYRITQDSATRL